MEEEVDRMVCLVQENILVLLERPQEAGMEVGVNLAPLVVLEFPVKVMRAQVVRVFQPTQVNPH